MKFEKGWNADRKGCEKCVYSMKVGLGTIKVACDYLSITGKRRGCDGANCDKFEKATKESMQRIEKMKLDRWEASE